jgi:hypothetical protein
LRRFVPLAASALLLAAPATADADEGMWLLDAFPSDLVKARHGFGPDRAWLDRVRLASVRLAGGCSGSFVSPDGLVLTNHHCAAGCISQLSTAERDLTASGYLAATVADERRCPEIEVNVLVEIRDVTARVRKATEGLGDAVFNAAQKAEMTRIEQECADKGRWRCDVVTLFHGGAYHLYRYERHQDVRLVFAPEMAIAFFGGDPDNFMFPRYDMDLSLLRVYRDDKPLRVKDFFRFDPDGAKEDELVFVSGHPGSTDRLLTVAQLEFRRDVAFPRRLVRLAELRGLLTQFGRGDSERKRISTEDLFSVENSYKAYSGMAEALRDREMLAAKVAAEQALKARVASDPELAGRTGRAWDEVAAAMVRYRDFYDRHVLLESGQAFSSELFVIARTLVRGAEERTKPNEKRLREYRDSNLPSVTQRLFSTAPIYPELETLGLTFSLTKLRELLGTGDGAVREVLGNDSPEDLAAALVRATKLADPAVRRALWEGGKAATDASDDPMIALARRIDDEARAVRARFEDTVEAPVKQWGERIAQAHFATRKDRTCPDATFTLRLAFGKVAGYLDKGVRVDPITRFRGLFERATGKDPFRLPDSWVAARERLSPDTPMNFASTADIIGGNSGSPVIDRDARLVGLIFDGNIQSLGGAFWFDESVNRAVAVSSAAILEALGKVYGADRLVRELSPR